ncbi:MAG TPA: DUF2145 domain-containing protein [Alphaproteobacteria bacterium]|nr:DUF2145 domain-containing protein [Alphaproteobacteria bacterium]
MIAGRIRGALLALLLALAAPAAGAGEAGGSEAGSRAAALQPPEAAAAFAKTVERELAARGARVALVARLGRDPADMPEGVRFTHVAAWVYSAITLADGRVVNGYVAHNLYQEPEALGRSTLVQDYPAEFFLGATRLRAGILIPDPRLQAKLLAALTDGTAARLHVPAYSVVASPYDARFQNCTEHLLDLTIAAVYDTTDMARIKRIARQHFEGTPIPLGGFARAFGPAFVAGLETVDHEGPIRTATFESLSAFMGKHGLAEAMLTLEGAEPPAAQP